MVDMPAASVTRTRLLAAVARPDGLILAADAGAVGLNRELRTELERGGVIRLRWGVYMPTTAWTALSMDARYLATVRACAVMSERPPTFSHYSAAAVWGLPRVGAWPDSVHILVPPAAGGRSRNRIIRHPDDGSADVVERDGLSVTSAASTAVAMARILPFPEAVAMMDKAIHVPRYGSALATRKELDAAVAALGASGRSVGRTAAQRAAAFATTLSGSCGESISRAHMFLLGFLLPELQTPFSDAEGLIGYTDYFWRTVKRIGEFDGLGKYLREEHARGRTHAQILIEEKIREDRLRACGPSVFRWGWAQAMNLSTFGGFLARNGIPRVR
ncbi:hypothetical protein [Glaciibacter sp. 2TAF33]|uniref:hypothetical protein n=1 Tax=Glaciibacter sp. 2TAF33 TaxID=3233015 RepID=UPI003F92BD60